MSRVETTDIPTHVPIKELPQPQQERVAALETKTDEVFRLRTQLVSFYRENRQYLPEQTVVDPSNPDKPKKHIMRLGDIQKALTEGAKLDDLIAFDRVDMDIDLNLDENLSPRERQLAKWRGRIHVKGSIERALRTYNDLKDKGGMWGDNQLDSEEQDIRNFYKMRWGELGAAVRNFDTMQAKAQDYEDMLDIASNDPRLNLHPEDMRLIRDEYNGVLNKLRSLADSNPEMYLYALGKQLLDAKRSFDEHGRIVETPYVKAKLARIEAFIDTGRPVFIHGELGSGKTEIGKHIVRTRLSRPHLARWEAANPRPSDGDPTAVKAWEARRSEEAEALVIEGQRNIEQEQITAARSIHRAEAPSPDQQVRIIQEGWERFKTNTLNQVKQAGGNVDEMAQRLETTDRALYINAYQDAFRSPVETKTVLAPFLRAMKEGRPLIIDEINAIPHYTLIVLNDLLLRKPGEMVTPPFPDLEPFVVQEGFSVIATGNYKPEDGKLYVGRQQIDAAFISRFGLVSYDYLPMQKTMEPIGYPPEAQREFRLQNELYHMLVARFLNDNLSVELPEGSLDQVYRLAWMARNIQDIFTGREVDLSVWGATKEGATVRPHDVLMENVLSIRHLIPILDDWGKKDKFQRSLDDYLFLEYVSRSDARPQEKLFLYSKLQAQGDFFKPVDGWPDMTDVDAADKVLRYSIDERIYGVDPITGRAKTTTPNATPLRTYSAKEVIEKLYGPAPEREAVTTAFLEVKPVEHKTAAQTSEEELERMRVAEYLRRAGAPLFEQNLLPEDIHQKQQPEQT